MVTKDIEILNNITNYIRFYILNNQEEIIAK